MIKNIFTPTHVNVSKLHQMIYIQYEYLDNTVTININIDDPKAPKISFPVVMETLDEVNNLKLTIYNDKGHAEIFTKDMTVTMNNVDELIDFCEKAKGYHKHIMLLIARTNHEIKTGMYSK